MTLSLREQDTCSEDTEGEAAEPIVGQSVVSLEPRARSDYLLCFQHWSSTTPEIQVLPARLAAQARSWVERDGHVPPQALDWVSSDAPILYVLFLVEASVMPVTAGLHWRISAALTRLLSHMVLIVERSLTRILEDVDPDPTAELSAEMCEYSMPDGVLRTTPTSFELFMWVSVIDHPLPTVRHAPHLRLYGQPARH